MTEHQDSLESYLNCAFGQMGLSTGELIRKVISAEIAIHQESINMIQQSYFSHTDPPVVFQVHPDNTLPGILSCLASDIGKNTGDFLRRYQLLKISQHQRAIDELKNLLREVGNPI